MPKAKTAAKPKNLNIKLVKSLIGSKDPHIATAYALGLRKVGDQTVQPDNAATAGKIASIRHLVEVSEAVEATELKVENRVITVQRAKPLVSPVKEEIEPVEDSPAQDSEPAEEPKPKKRVRAPKEKSEPNAEAPAGDSEPKPKKRAKAAPKTKPQEGEDSSTADGEA